MGTQYFCMAYIKLFHFQVISINILKAKWAIFGLGFPQRSSLVRRSKNTPQPLRRVRRIRREQPKVHQTIKKTKPIWWSRESCFHNISSKALSKQGKDNRETMHILMKREKNKRRHHHCLIWLIRNRNNTKTIQIILQLDIIMSASWSLLRRSCGIVPPYPYNGKRLSSSLIL